MKKVKKYAFGGMPEQAKNPGFPSQANVPTLPSQASSVAQGIMAGRRPDASPVATPAVKPAGTPASAPAPAASINAPMSQTAEVQIPQTAAAPAVTNTAAPSTPGTYNLMNSVSTVPLGYKKGGAVKAKPKKMASGGKVSSASKRADGCAQRGKTRGRMV